MIPHHLPTLVGLHPEAAPINIGNDYGGVPILILDLKLQQQTREIITTGKCQAVQALIKRMHTDAINAARRQCCGYIPCIIRIIEWISRCGADSDKPCVDIELIEVVCRYIQASIPNRPADKPKLPPEQRVYIPDLAVPLFPAIRIDQFPTSHITKDRILQP